MSNRIKELRKKRGLTLDELSSEIGIPNSTISQYENERRTPKKEAWEKFADYFNVSVSYIKGFGYSKEYIIKCIIDGYKENFHTSPEVLTVGDKDVETKDKHLKVYIDKYLKYVVGVKDVDKDKSLMPFEWWEKNLDSLFDLANIKDLLTTHDHYSKDDILQTVTLLLVASMDFIQYNEETAVTNYRVQEFIKSLKYEYDDKTYREVILPILSIIDIFEALNKNNYDRQDASKFRSHLGFILEELHVLLEGDEYDAKYVEYMDIAYLELKETLVKMLKE